MPCSVPQFQVEDFFKNELLLCTNANLGQCTMSLLTIPFEILEKILFHLDLPTKISGRYEDTGNSLQWLNHDILSLTAVNSELRQIMLDYIWRDISITILDYYWVPGAGEESVLVVGDFLTTGKDDMDFLHLFLQNAAKKAQPSKEFYCLFPQVKKASDTPALLSTQPFSLFPQFSSHIRTFRINTHQDFSWICEEKQDAQFGKHYASVLGLVNPIIMPALETLHLRLELDGHEDANDSLGQALETYSKPVRLVVYLESMLDLASLEQYGLYPFIEEIIITEKSDHDAPTQIVSSVNLDLRGKLPNLQRLSIESVVPEGEL